VEETRIEPKLPKKLTLNKETIRVLTYREMMEVQGATCNNPRSTCVDRYTDGCNTYTTCP
jgi:hypothetical protein